MEKKLGQEPAFPLEYEDYNSTGLLCKRQEFGISKRLYIATMVIQGIVSDTSVSLDDTSIMGIVRLAYKTADEMLKQEEE